jgi:phosphatidate cytidylyltransferase
MLFTVLVLVVMQFRRRQHAGATVAISTTLFGVLYIAWCLSFVIRIRFLHNGIALLTGLLLITKLGDIGAFLIGSRFGRMPLIPSVSPKKTVEGAIGGLMFSMLGAMVMGPFIGVARWQLACIGLLLGALAQTGDLSESLIKRDCQVKDSGSVIPGMGGVLDLVDSLIFAAPVYYFYAKVFVK